MQPTSDTESGFVRSKWTTHTHTHKHTYSNIDVCSCLLWKCAVLLALTDLDFIHNPTCSRKVARRLWEQGKTHKMVKAHLKVGNENTAINESKSKQMNQEGQRHANERERGIGKSLDRGDEGAHAIAHLWAPQNRGNRYACDCDLNASKVIHHVLHKYYGSKSNFLSVFWWSGCFYALAVPSFYSLSGFGLYASRHERRRSSITTVDSDFPLGFLFARNVRFC